jgi:hypothetical protein
MLLSSLVKFGQTSSTVGLQDVLGSIHACYVCHPDHPKVWTDIAMTIRENEVGETLLYALWRVAM